MITCCMDCQRRHLGCHAKCPDYQAIRKAADKAAEDRQKAVLTSYDVKHSGDFIGRKR